MKTTGNTAQRNRRRLQPVVRRVLTWGDIYYKWLRKGTDHGYAAYMADQWHKRKFGKYPKEINMGASREGFDLFRETGRSNFVRYLKRGQFNGYVWRDTFAQIWCWIVGHKSYDSNHGHGTPEPACKRCGRYL